MAWHARELSLLAGLGLVVFEGAELAWIGFQPLEAVFGAVGLAVMWTSPREDSAGEFTSVLMLVGVW